MDNHDQEPFNDASELVVGEPEGNPFGLARDNGIKEASPIHASKIPLGDPPEIPKRPFNFTKLPVELQKNILEFLAIDAIGEIANFRIVSSGSKKIVDSNPSLYLNGLTPDEILSKSKKLNKNIHIPDAVYVCESVVSAFLNHATPERFPNPSHLVSVLIVVAQHGNDAQRDTILTEHATPECFPDPSDRVAVLSTIVKYGNDAQRDAILTKHATLELLPNPSDRVSVLRDVAQHGNDAQRNAILTEHATPERLPDPSDRVLLLKDIAKHGNDAQRDAILTKHATLERLPNPFHRVSVLTDVARYGGDAQRNRVLGLATLLNFPDSSHRKELINAASAHVRDNRSLER